MEKRNLLYSALSAGIAEIITIPVCTTKTVYQTGVHIRSTCGRHTGINTLSYSIKNIYNNHGIRGFYRGITPAFTAQIITASLRITLYEFFVRNQLNFWLAGVLSAVLITVVTHPLDVVRITFQNSSAVDTSKNPVKIPFIYTGWTKSFYKALIGGGTFLPLRSYIKENNPTLPSIQVNLLTAVISTVIITPVDYFKTAVIGNVVGSRITYKDILKNPFKGLSLNLLRVVPHFTVMMTVYDWMVAKKVFSELSVLKN